MRRAVRIAQAWCTPVALVTLVLALLLSACGATRKDPPALSEQPPDPCADSTYQNAIDALLAARRQPPGSNASYTVGTGDLLVITVYNYRPAGGDFSSDVRVDDRGYISLPMMEPIHVAGLSLAQVHRAIVVGLRRADVMKEPLVSVFLKDYQGQEVVVLGAVARPGMYHLSRGKQTLVDVLSMAGGLSPTAGNYLLIRPAAAAGTGGEANAAAYAIRNAAATEPAGNPANGQIPVCFDTAGGDPDPTLMILQARGGDLIIVPDAGHGFIEGEVEKPGPYPLTRGMTLTQLIASAGGLTFPADSNHVKLIRQMGNGSTNEWDVDIERNRSENLPDIRLSRNDRVIVPYRTGRKAVYGVYEFVTTIVRITVGGAANIF